jgi:hypothetical protein
MIDGWLIDLPPLQRLAWQYLVGYVRESSVSQKRPNIASALSSRTAARVWAMDAGDIDGMITAAVAAGELVVTDGTWVVTDSTRFVSERTLQRLAAGGANQPDQLPLYDSDGFADERDQEPAIAEERTSVSQGDGLSGSVGQTVDLSANAATYARDAKDKGQVTTTSEAREAEKFSEPPPGLEPAPPWWEFSDRPLIRETMTTIRACPVWAKIPEPDLPDEQFLLRVLGDFSRRVGVTDEDFEFEIRLFGEHYRKLRPTFNPPSPGVKLAEWFRRAAPRSDQSTAPTVPVRTNQRKATPGEIARQAKAMTEEALAASAPSSDLRKVNSW